MCTKTLAALLNKSKPNETFTIVKKEFTVTHNWKPIGTVEYNFDSKACHIKWFPSATDLRIDTDNIDAEFATKRNEKKQRV